MNFGFAAVKPIEPADDAIVGVVKRYMIQQSLPLWSARGWDSTNGGFVEKLGKDGAADNAAIRRLRVQARQIWCFAKAETLGWFPGGRKLALDGLDYLLSKGRSPDGKPGFVHMLNPDGSVANDLRDTYDHAFVLLALAALYQLDKDSQIREHIDRTLAFLDEQLRAPHGGFLEGVPAASPRRQNPHMHLFEAMLSLYEATQDPMFLARAGEMYGLFATCLLDPDTQTLLEFFADDWTKVAGPSGDVEPGHQAEWVWLLMWYQRLSGRPTGNYRRMLLDSALRYTDEPTGCLMDEGDAAGNVTKDTRRCWPQTECAKAWIAQAESGEHDARTFALQALERLRSHYLIHPVAGGWYDQFDRDGRSVVDAIPASTMYHVLCAVAEADRVLGKGGSK